VLKHGAVVIAAITSCTNTSNPGVMLGAALLCKNAVKKGLKILPYIKTSLSPGSQAVSRYLELSGLRGDMEAMGFYHAGYGCMTCIGNSGDIDKEVEEAIKQKDLCVASVLSGNRNFEGRVHPLTKANFLASPLLVVAFAIAGTVDIDFQAEPIGNDSEGKPVFLRDIWPSQETIEKIEGEVIKPEIYKETYKRVSEGTERWNKLSMGESLHFAWNEQSTYIHRPPFFDSAQKDLPSLVAIENAYILAVFGDSITTDHISPAGNISVNSPAGRFLKSKGVEKKDFNSYGARRGNDLVMARGTFANIRINNKMMKGKIGPQTVYVPTNETLDIFDAAEKYKVEGGAKPLVIFGGKEYGSGSSRDWAAKGPYLQGVRAVIAQSF
jgi:aconitate hydratase